MAARYNTQFTRRGFPADHQQGFSTDNGGGGMAFSNTGQVRAELSVQEIGEQNFQPDGSDGYDQQFSPTRSPLQQSFSADPGRPYAHQQLHHGPYFSPNLAIVNGPVPSGAPTNHAQYGNFGPAVAGTTPPSEEDISVGSSPAPGTGGAFGFGFSTS